MNGPPLEDDVAHIQAQLDIAREIIARQSGDIATLNNANAELTFDIKYLKAEIIKLRHELQCQTNLTPVSKGDSL